MSKISRLKKAVETLKKNCYDGAPFPAMLTLQNQTGIQIDYTPQNFNQIIESFNKNCTTLGTCIDAIEVKNEIKAKCKKLLNN